jgi:aldehyde:ferredoxin oxidoreductase
MVAVMEVLHRVCNSLGVCIWNTAAWNVEWIDRAELAELYSAATGWETSAKDFEKLTMKQLNLEKALNLRFTDFDRKDDMPTQRALNDPIPRGSLAGFTIDEAKWNKMLDDYYHLHGWDRETSYPTRKTLVDLDLGTVADDLERIGKLR